MQIRFWSGRAWRNGTIVRTLSRGARRGWYVVEYPHNATTKTIYINPAAVGRRGQPLCELLGLGNT